MNFKYPPPYRDEMNNAKVEGYVFLAKESVEIGMDKCFFFILYLWLKFSWLYEF